MRSRSPSSDWFQSSSAGCGCTPPRSITRMHYATTSAVGFTSSKSCTDPATCQGDLPESACLTVMPVPRRCQYRGESLTVGDRDGDSGMAQDAHWLDAPDRLTEGDAQAAGTVGGHGQSSIGERKVCRPCGLDKAEWPGNSGGRHIGEGCSYSPGSESDGKLVTTYLYRRVGRGDTEGQTGQPVRSSEPEREGLRRHRMELPNNVRLKPAVAAHTVSQRACYRGLLVPAQRVADQPQCGRP